MPGKTANAEMYNAVGNVSKQKRACGNGHGSQNALLLERAWHECVQQPMLLFKQHLVIRGAICDGDKQCTYRCCNHIS